MRRFLIALATGLLTVSPALAQTAAPDQVDKTVRASAASLAQAQSLLLQIPDLVAQVRTLESENARLKAENAKLKAPAKPEPTKPAQGAP